MTTNPSYNGWDWPYILYVGRVLLRYREDEIWRLTPRQFDAQLKVHKDIETMKYGGTSSSAANVPQQPTGFIDQIPGW